MKAVRIQVDMLYKVEDGQSAAVFEHDTAFFEGIKADFDKWETNKSNPRTPVSFDLRYHMGGVQDEEE